MKTGFQKLHLKFKFKYNTLINQTDESIKRGREHGQKRKDNVFFL